jgi:delta-aminolevulinic acid dehydratase/porphobilinogen synthase
MRRVKDETGFRRRVSWSGEYAMVKLRRWTADSTSDGVVLLVTPTRRAGADLIVTYRANDAAGWLRG